MQANQPLVDRTVLAVEMHTKKEQAIEVPKRFFVQEYIVPWCRARMEERADPSQSLPALCAWMLNSVQNCVLQTVQNSTPIFCIVQMFQSEKRAASTVLTA